MTSQKKGGGTYCVHLSPTRIESLAVDVTLAREKNDWTNLGVHKTSRGFLLTKASAEL